MHFWNFSNVQHTHGVACKNYSVLPYRTGYEQVIGNRVDDLFVVTAEADGIVTNINQGSLTVSYSGKGQKPLAVIIKDNLVYINSPQIKDIANIFYNDVKTKLENLGYIVNFDEGKELTIPDQNASVWVAHSKGQDRLRFAPKTITTLALETKSDDGNDINHYQLSDKDIKNILLLKPKENGGSIYSKSYELGIKHGTVTGTTVPHNRITDMVIGQKFKMFDALIYDDGFFGRSELEPGSVVYKAGVISRVAFLENIETNEDGTVISEKLAKQLITPTTTLHAVVVDFDMEIHNLLKIGDEVHPESILCTLENYLGEDSENKDSEAIRALSRLSNYNPKAGIYGKISNIEVLYFGKTENMRKSLVRVVNYYDNIRANKVRLIGSNNAKTGQIDETIRVANKKIIANQVVVKIYIDHNLGMDSGDKIVISNALKSTISRVATDKILDEKNGEVDALFGYNSVSARIVNSPIISGVMNTLLKEISLQMGKMYHD